MRALEKLRSGQSWHFNAVKSVVESGMLHQTLRLAENRWQNRKEGIRPITTAPLGDTRLHVIAEIK